MLLQDSLKDSIPVHFCGISFKMTYLTISRMIRCLCTRMIIKYIHHEGNIYYVQSNLKKETDLASVQYKENLLQSNVKNYEALIINLKPQKDQAAINEITLDIDGNEIHSDKTLKILILYCC